MNPLRRALLPLLHAARRVSDRQRWLRHFSRAGYDRRTAANLAAARLREVRL